jgi:hypothetical protein
VAVGQAFPRGDGIIHGKPIPPGYARVSIDKILDKKYNKIHIDFLVEEDRPCLVHNLGTHVAWRKRFIKLDEQPSSNDEDDSESSASPPPPPPQPKEKTPPPPRKSKVRSGSTSQHKRSSVSVGNAP